MASSFLVYRPCCFIYYISTGLVILLRGEGGHLREVWVGVCRRGFQTLTLFKTKSVHFNTLIKTSDLYILLVLCVFVRLVFHFHTRNFFFYINDILG